MDEEIDWKRYEHQMVQEYARQHPHAIVKHWDHVSEQMLEESGYIHNRNQWRLKRKREGGAVSDYGLDGMAKIGPDEFHGLQAKHRQPGYTGKLAHVFVWTEQDEVDETIQHAVKMIRYLDSAPLKWKTRIGFVETDYDAPGLGTVDRRLPELIERACTLCCTGREKWFMRLSDTQKFIEIYNRCPSSTAKATQEKLLGRWIRKQSVNYNNGLDCKFRMRDVSVRLEWVEFCHKYPVTNPDKWQRTCEVVDGFIALNGRLPSASSPNEDERKLGAWIGYQKTHWDTATKQEDGTHQAWKLFSSASVMPNF